MSTEGPPRCRPLGLKNQTAYFCFQPNIQTPEFSLLSDWTTIDPSLPDYEISMNLIEEKLEKYLNRFVKMKEERHSNFSFALYSTITCLFGIFIGQKISGIYLFYLAFILVTAVPIIFRDEILGTIYGPIFTVQFLGPIFRSNF